MQKAYPPLRSTPVNGILIDNFTMPVHDGAIKYYKEVGLWTDKHDERQRARLAIGQ